MAKEPVQHESLLLPGYWRITSFGALTENPAAAAGDLLIRADLAELANWEDSPVDWGRVTGRQRRMLVPVGELPRLHLNAVLHDGRLANDLVDRLEFERWMRREINCDRSNITVITRDHKDDQGNYVVPVRAKWASQLSDHDRHGLFVAFGSGEDPYALVIPCVEVFRFFYATSDVLAKYLLKDRFLDPGAYLWNPSKTAISRTDGKAVLWLRKWMLDADARFLARFAFDEYALGQAQAIFLSTAAANEPSHERRIRALPPFQGTEEVTFLGIPLGSEERPRIFVTRLLSCDWKPPFTELKWDRDNDGRSDPNKREERPPTEWKPSLLSVPHDDTQEPAALSTSPPSVASVPSRVQEQEIVDRFPELNNIPAQKLPQEGATTRAAHQDWKPVMREAYQGSVVDGTSSGDIVGRTVIEALEHRPEQAPKNVTAVDDEIGRVQYLDILGLLRRIRDAELAKVEFLVALDCSATLHGVDFNVFPDELDGKPRAWLYVDAEKKKRRTALLAEVEFEGRRRYIIELQQRRDGECSTLVAWQRKELRLSRGLLAVLMMDCARAEAARLDSAVYLQIPWARLHHTTPDADDATAKYFLQRIFSAKPLKTRSDTGAVSL